MTKAPSIDLQRIADSVDDARPIIDPILEVVLVDCPDCHAQDSDPTGLWRPAMIVPRGKLTTFDCGACGSRHEQ